MKWGESADGKIEYTTMTMEDAKEGLEVLRAGFFPDENICIVWEVNSNPAACRELEDLCLDAAKDGVSILARDKITKKIAGVTYNKIQVKGIPGEQNYFEKFRDTKCVEKNSIGLINDMIYVDSLVDAFDTYNADCSLELMFLGTHPDFRQRGIGTDLVKYSLALGRSLGKSKQKNIPQISTAIFTANASYKIGLNLEFDELCKVKYSDMTTDSVTYDKKIDTTITPGMSLMAKRL